MNRSIYVPHSLKDAGRDVRLSLTGKIEDLPTENFVRAWCAMAYLFPGLHPDGFEDLNSGWPSVPRRFAAEAWRRADTGELADDQLYACDAQWSGIFDRMLVHLPDEMERHLKIAVAYGDK